MTNSPDIDALVAAGVVRPLGWKPNPYDKDGEWWYAASPLGFVYEVYLHRSGKWRVQLRIDLAPSFPDADTLSDGIKLAEADHATRIISALDPALLNEIKAAREDERRMDWLVSQHVEVPARLRLRCPLRCTARQRRGGRRIPHHPSRADRRRSYHRGFQMTETHETFPTRALRLAEAYIQEYEWDDTDTGHHVPTEAERMLMLDMINGLFGDDAFLAALSRHPLRPVGGGEAVAWRYRYVRQTGADPHWIVRQSPIAASPLTEQWAGVEVQPLYTLPPPPADETTWIERSRSNAAKYAEGEDRFFAAIPTPPPAEAPEGEAVAWRGKYWVEEKWKYFDQPFDGFDPEKYTLEPLFAAAASPVITEEMIDRACEEADWIVKPSTDPVEDKRITANYRAAMCSILTAALSPSGESGE